MSEKKRKEILFRRRNLLIHYVKIIINIVVEDYVLSENIVYSGCDSLATDIVVDDEVSSTSSETIEQI